MSMFRRPGDSSSSEDDSSDSREETSAIPEDSFLSRINTLDSAQSRASARGPSGLQVTQKTSSVSRSTASDHIRDLVLHSLLEDKATEDAARHLGKDKSDPDVQKLARETYRGLAQQLSGNVDDKYASDEMKDKRIAAKEGINNATQLHLTGLSAATNGPGTGIAAASQALITRSAFALGVENPRMESVLGLPSPIPLILQGHPGLHTDRYAREYEEIGMVGKGGYGKVFKVKHKLDNSFYAVKKIAVSPTKMQRIQEHGVQELESLLEEVRSLARFDHGNIVRYHSAWFEFSSSSTSAPVSSNGVIFGPERLLGHATAPSFNANSVEHLHTDLDNMNPFEESQNLDAGIVFEYSDTGAGASEPRNETPAPTRRRNRRESEATIATVSSTHSRTGITSSAIDEDEEEDIETIPRSHEPTFEDSSSLLSVSDMPKQLIPTRHTGPLLTLNVQMSLYDTTLAAFLTPDPPPPTHCFHPAIALHLLSSILSGVEYLHARGLVHRDLKPANVFLALSADRVAPAGSVDLASCRACPARTAALHLTPRIGDFGLVAALGADAAERPVGTEFYRPPGGMVAPAVASEKLDVFALGVLAVELLQCFGTRMERIEALTKLRRGELPGGFAAGAGDMEGEVVKLVRGMVAVEEEQRLGCEEVRERIGRIVGGLGV